MLPSLLLALAVGAGAAATPASVFEARICPRPAAALEADNASVHRLELARAECLRGAMEKAFARAERGLAPETAGRWRKIQDVYGRWAVDACQLSEDLVWEDLDLRKRSDGSLRGLPTIACLQGVYGERAFLGATLAGKAEAPEPSFDGIVRSRQPLGALARLFLGRILAKAHADVALPPPAGEGALGPADFRALTALADRVWQTTVELAERQCKAAGGAAGAAGAPASYCVARTESYLFSLIDVSGGRPAQRP